MSYAERILERHADPHRCYYARTGVQSVVSFFGSFRSCPDAHVGDSLVQQVTAGLLDRGTRTRSKFEIAELLEMRGAHRSYYTESLRIGFSGKALSNDVADVIRIIAEELREPGFSADEVETKRGEVAARLRRSLEATGDLAEIALRARLFRPGHPNHAWSAREQLEQLESISVESVRAYHEGHFGSRDFQLVFVGDVDIDAAHDAVEDAFGDWENHPSLESFDPAAHGITSGTEDIQLQGKPNVDVKMGHALTLRRDSSDYIPLYVANYILGGNFSARLMQIVRDELGLTYGVRSALRGVTVDHDGFWEIGVTLSGENVARGIDATDRVVRAFVDQGALEKELEAKKATISGAFKVGLATTGGLGRTILANVERGFGPAYLDRFTGEVNAVTLDEVNEAVARHLRPDNLHVVRSGTLPVPADESGRNAEPTPSA
jgi:predicted Zn-dependent peptidase